MLKTVRVLSGVKISDMQSLSQAIQALHDTYRIPHIVITSVDLEVPDQHRSHLSIVGSSMTSTGKARLFKITFPAIDCYFSGTGDMFAALMVVRMREAVAAGSSPELAHRPSWLSDDDVSALDLPLARAAEKVLATMHEVLSRTRERMEGIARSAPEVGEADDDEKKRWLQKTKAAELQLVRHPECLRNPTVLFRAMDV
jgi:pyridoxine kinase